jgi:hypothetical protein
VRYRIFTQTPGGRLEPAWLAPNARRWFHSSIVVLENGARRLRLRIRGDFASEPVEIAIATRPADKGDQEDAKIAETRGRAAGMAELAARCAHVWELEADDSAPIAAVMTACAAAASVALGPVLPPDGSTLFGVRGAIDRARGASRS